MSIRSCSAVQDFMGARTAEPWNGHTLLHDAFFTKRTPSNIVSGEIKHPLFDGFFLSAGQIAIYPQSKGSGLLMTHVDVFSSSTGEESLEAKLK